MTFTIDGSYVLRTLAEMVSIDSALPHEESLARYIAGELESMGAEVEWEDVAPGRPNVCAKVELGAVDRFLVFSGHSDTVPVVAGWESDPFQLTELDGRLYGLGAFNMKGGLACMLAAFKALLDAKELHRSLGRIGIGITVDQEGESLGARALLNTPYARCDAMLHAEHFFGDDPARYLPIAGTVKILYRIIFQGRAGHAFRPYEGINAVVDAARVIGALGRLKLGQHPLLGRGTLCALKIEGGYKTYSVVVPEHCEIVVTRLTMPGESRQKVIDELAALIDSLQLDSVVTIETPPPSYEPYFTDENTPILEAFRGVYQEIIGLPPCFAGHCGITDANVFAGEGGIPTVVFGPAGANHHRPGEYVVKDSLVPVASVYAETARRFFAWQQHRSDRTDTRDL